MRGTRYMLTRDIHQVHPHKTQLTLMTLHLMSSSSIGTFPPGTGEGEAPEAAAGLMIVSEGLLPW
jgi:hypothetical protein